MYFGSWNEWSRDPSLPIEEGPALSRLNRRRPQHVSMQRSTAGLTQARGVRDDWPGGGR